MVVKQNERRMSAKILPVTQVVSLVCHGAIMNSAIFSADFMLYYELFMKIMRRFITV